MIRLATIGTNFITDWLMEGILELDEIQLTAVYSRNLEKYFQYHFSIRGFCIRAQCILINIYERRQKL